MRIDGIARKLIARLLQLLGESERHCGVFIEDDPPAIVILDECGPELSD